MKAQYVATLIVLIAVDRASMIFLTQKPRLYPNN